MEPIAGNSILPPGTLLDEGNIILGECLGKGGFGITYKAFDKTRDAQIVIKEFFPSKMVSRLEDNSVFVPYEKQSLYQEHLRSFCREARIIHALKAHPNIVKVYFTLEENNTAYYGMEFLQGMDLTHYLAQRKKLSFEEAYNLLLPVMGALRYAHKQNVLHRDISPNNIFMVQGEAPDQYKPILIDFGAAHVARSGFTKTFPRAYKVGYSPYEQVSGNTERQGTWSDVYSMCATLYYAITHIIPPASSLIVLNGERIVSPREMGFAISEAQERVLMKGMSLNTKERQQNIEQLLTEMQQSLGNERSVPVSVPAGGIKPDYEPREKQNDTNSFLSEAIPGRGMAALILLLEMVLFYGTAYLLSPGWFVPIGYVVMVLLNIVLSLLGPHGSLLMPFVRLWIPVENRAPGKIVLFHLLRSIFILPLLDALIACVRKGLSLCEQVAKVRVAPFEQVQYTETNTVTYVNSARLFCNSGELAGRSMELLPGSSIGREESMVTYVVAGDSHVSKKHCEFGFSDNRWYLKDCQSRNGTIVDGIRVKDGNSVTLKSGSRIRIGHNDFTFISEMR